MTDTLRETMEAIIETAQITDAVLADETLTDDEKRELITAVLQ